MNPNNNPLNFYIIVNTDCGIHGGKIHAQVGHAVQYWCELHMTAKEEFADSKYNKFAKKIVDIYRYWSLAGSPKIVLAANKEVFNSLRKHDPICIIKDAGHTQVAPGTETVMAFIPMRKSDVPLLIKELKLL